jgi:tRNA pseudouridine38-40 synthase
LTDPSRHHFSPEPLPPGQRLALRVEYDGSGFCGWQAQPHLTHIDTVQADVESALGKIAGQPLRVHCAGRTDTGVHATAQWIHFDAPVPRSLKSWLVGGNAQLPPGIRFTDAHAVAADFHARHSATARQYDYLIANTPCASAILARRVLWVREPLDARRMHEALQHLLGERDFSAFRAASCQSSTPMRCLESAEVLRRGDFVQLRVVANAFLHHMVRNLVGSALQVGLGVQNERWLGELLAGRDRSRAAATAPPDGLYLSGVRYPEEWGLPVTRDLPFFPSGQQD